MTDKNESTVVPGKQMRVILFDLHNLQVRLEAEQQRREKAEAEVAQMSDTRRNLKEALDHAWAVLYPNAPNSWDYPSQVGNHISVEVERLQAKLSQLLTAAHSLRDQSNEAGLTCLFCGCEYENFADPEQHAGGCPCVTLNAAIANAEKRGAT